MQNKKQEETMKDEDSLAYQRLIWDALQRSINSLVKKVNASNVRTIVKELCSENLIRGRGLFCRAILKSSVVSPNLVPVFAALVAGINTKFPDVGYLLLKRVLVQIKFAYERNDKVQLLLIVKLLAHLVNQSVVDELLPFQLLMILLQDPCEDNVEVAVTFILECGNALRGLFPLALDSVFGCLREILHEGKIHKQCQCLIEGLFAVRRAKFSGYPDFPPELDIVELDDEVTHEISFGNEIDPELFLDSFRPDPDFLENEERYAAMKRAALGEEDVILMSQSEEDDDYFDSDDNGEDETNNDLVDLRRKIYMTVMSGIDFEEAGHKLLTIPLSPVQEMEVCALLVECCSHEIKYRRFYALLAQHLCLINKVYQDNFERCFLLLYSNMHRLETQRLQNVARLFAHLLASDALPWKILSCIHLTKDTTLLSARTFIQVFFQELSEQLGIESLKKRLNDPTLQGSLSSVFPKDYPENTLSAIKFFTSIGLGGITENLREYLRNSMLSISRNRDESGSEAVNKDQTKAASQRHWKRKRTE